MAHPEAKSLEGQQGCPGHREGGRSVGEDLVLVKVLMVVMVVTVGVVFNSNGSGGCGSDAGSSS